MSHLLLSNMATSMLYNIMLVSVLAVALPTSQSLSLSLSLCSLSWIFILKTEKLPKLYLVFPQKLSRVMDSFFYFCTKLLLFNDSLSIYWHMSDILSYFNYCAFHHIAAWSAVFNPVKTKPGEKYHSIYILVNIEKDISR